MANSVTSETGNKATLKAPKNEGKTTEKRTLSRDVSSEKSLVEVVKNKQVSSSEYADLLSGMSCIQPGDRGEGLRSGAYALINKKGNCALSIGMRDKLGITEDLDNLFVSYAGGLQVDGTQDFQILLLNRKQYEAVPDEFRNAFAKVRVERGSEGTFGLRAGSIAFRIMHAKVAEENLVKSAYYLFKEMKSEKIGLRVTFTPRDKADA